MRIKVLSVGKPWRATDQSDPLWTIILEGNGEPQKTFDEALAHEGEHEAEEYTAKSGKTYWRTPKAPRGSYGAPKVFKADPDKMKQEWTLETARNLSIQRQVAVKAAVELVVAGKREYDELYDTFGHLMTLLTEKDWKDAVHPMSDEDDEGDQDEVDLPPVSVYEDQIS